MLASVLLPDSCLLQFEWLAVEENRVTVVLTAVQPEAQCPVCGQGSHSIHSHYGRTVADLPWAGVPVRLKLRVRKFFCRNAACGRTVFTERLPTVVAAWARRSLRLTDQQRWLGLEMGGETAARTGQRLGLPTSPDTVLRLVHYHTVPSRPTPRILGVDDWAWCKGQRYGTILVNLETHEPVDLLPDRTADSLAQWLQVHPGVEVISRDRSGAYADGATRGAPEAVQVADRFHLLANLREVLEAVVMRHRSRSETLARSAVTAKESRPEDASDVQPACIEPPTRRHASAAALRYEPTRQANRARRKARYDEVVTLYQQGLSQKAIAVRLGLSRKTIRSWLRSGMFPERAPTRKRKTPLSAFEAYLDARWSDGCHNGVQLWRELCRQGYMGSRTPVAQWVAQQRRADPGQRAPVSAEPPLPSSQPLVPERVRSPRQLSWLLAQDRAVLDTEQQVVLDQLIQANPAIGSAHSLAQDFRHIVKEQKAEAFEVWLAAVMASDLPDLKRFASSLRRDAAAVIAALSLPFSNGPVEGHVNRLKFIKRQGYGRAGFTLLKQRILAA